MYDLIAVESKIFFFLRKNLRVSPTKIYPVLNEPPSRHIISHIPPTKKRRVYWYVFHILDAYGLCYVVR